MVAGSEIADAALNRIWRNDEDGRAILLHITDAGLAAIGVVPDGADSGSESAAQADARVRSPNPPASPEDAHRTPTLRPGTKQARLIDMLRAKDGATIAEIVAATGWQPHTVRGTLSGALKKRLGLKVNSERIEGRGRVYQLPPA